MTHTPSPWKLESEVPFGWIIRGEGNWIATAMNDHDDCKGFPSHETGESNARLIAAAPELLEALKNALMNEGQDACCLPILGHCSCWRCEARAAIQKAEGKE